MKFPHAYHGVKKIFYAEFVAIVAAIVALIATIIASFFGDSPSQGIYNANLTLNIITLAVSIVVFVIELIGLIQGSKDSREFRIGLWAIAVGIAASATSLILSSIESTRTLSPILFAVLGTVGTVADFVVVLCVLLGISALADRLGNGEMEERGRKLAFYIIIFYIVVLVFGLLPGFNGYIVNPGLRLFFSILSAAALVIEVFIYVSTLIYLHNATTMLEE